MSGRKAFAMIVAEFLGTYVLATAMMVMLVRLNLSFFSAAAAAVAYGLMILVVGFNTGANLNPAVTIGLWTTRKLATLPALCAIIAQMLGGLVAWKLGQYFLTQTLPSIASSSIDWRILIGEGVGALVLGFGLASAVVKKLDNTQTALVAALALFTGIAIASLAGNGLINPAVALAIRSWSWAYIVGPIIGSVVGMNLYVLLFADSSSASKKK